MKVFLSGSPTTAQNDLGADYIQHYGYLAGPRSWVKPPLQVAWGADNDAFSRWDRDAFIAMLRGIRHYPGCKFVVAPDVVGDAKATLKRFAVWHQVIRYYGLPVALAAQDGLEDHTVPWSLIDCLFIGGSTEWKLGIHAAKLITKAKQRGRWVHMGRVNSNRRIQYAMSLGCDSVDGSGYTRWRCRMTDPLPVLQNYQLPLGDLLCS